jgi:hypothetical protein
MSAGAWVRRVGLAALLAVPPGVAGCGGGDKPAGPTPAAPAGDADAEVTAERAKLPPEDRAAVDAQEWCVVNTGERLGSMGPPLKVVVNGQPVYVCCKGCARTAQADPDKTLATVAELRAKAKAGREGK